MKKVFFISLTFNVIIIILFLIVIFFIYNNYSYTGQGNYVYDNTINGSNYYQQFEFRRASEFSTDKNLFIDENYACKIGNIAINTSFKNYSFENKTSIILCEDLGENGKTERYYIVTRNVKNSSNNLCISAAINKDDGSVKRVWLSSSE